MEGQIKFLALNKPMDWLRGQGENLQITSEGIRLQYDKKYSLLMTVDLAQAGVEEPITSLCGGPYGLVFMLDAAANLWSYDFLHHEIRLLLKTGHDLFNADAAISLTNSTLLLLNTNPPSVTAVSAVSGQILWTAEDFLGGQPLALAANEQEDLLVVTAHLSSQGGEERVPLNIIKITVDGQVKLWAAPAEFTASFAAKSEINQRIQAVLAADETLYVSDNLSGELWVFDSHGSLINQQRLVPDGSCWSLGIDNEGSVYTMADSPILTSMKGNAGLLRLSADEDQAQVLLNLADCSGRLWLDRLNRLYIWNPSENVIRLYERHERIRLDNDGRPRGTYLLPLLDSNTPEMEWHRLALQVTIPDDTQIRLSYYASDRLETVISGQLINLPEFLSAPDISMADKLEQISGIWSRDLVNPRDLLLTGARGRYLWVKIEFIGSEDRTPVLRGVRAYYPRISLLNYLPAVYQHDLSSRDFLERFLSLFGTFLQGIEEKIDKVSSIFDPAVAHGPFLTWLAGWIGLNIDENWSEDQIRRLLTAAPSLYKKRGTREALEEIVAIYTGEKPLIVEYFQYKYLQELSEIKENMTRLYGQNPYGFTVLVKQERVPDAAQVITLQRIIDQEKPAFTEARLVILQPWMYMDMHSYLGINTYLSELSLLRLDNKSAMPFSSVIVDRERTSRVTISG